MGKFSGRKVLIFLHENSFGKIGSLKLFSLIRAWECED